jgi:glycosyltransferase involved in cell wall biosynthesis
MGGTSRQARRQAEGLRRLGHDTVVLTRRRRRTWSKSEVRDGVAVRRFIAPGRGALGDKASVVFLAWWLGLRRTRVASVQAIMYPDFAVGSVAAGLGARTVMVWAGLGDATDTLGPAHDPVRRWQRRARHRLLRSCRHVALTPSIRDELLALSIPSSKIDVIPVPVDVDRFRPPAPDERGRARADLGLSPDQLVVVYTGHLRALKGIDRLVDAFGRLVTEGPPDRGAAVLLLVGGGNAPDANEGELRAQVSAAGLDRSILFTGVVEDIVRFLWAADVFVLPSRREGLSNSLIEAMACGLACVAGPEAGGDQVLGDGAGIVPDSNESADLYDALCRIERDAALRARLGAAARQRAEQMSIERVAESYDTVLRQMTPPMKRTKRKS